MPHSDRLARPALLLTLLLLVTLAVAVAIGATRLSWPSVWAGDETARAILLRIRLPRVLLAAAIGATLAVAGVTFQTLLRNPLADPFILGVSGGAACGAAVSTALGFGRIPGVVPLVAFAGACGATAAVFLLARRRDHTDPTRLLLSGLVLNAFFSSVILIAFSLSKSSDLTAALRWMMGTLFGATWTSVLLVTSLLVLGMAVLAFLANDLRLLAFGEEDAKARGVNVERVKLIGFAAASIVTGAAVAVSGIIGFVGLLVPHLIRLIWRRDFRALLPLCALGGAILVADADLLSRVIVPSAELPVGAFTAILGVPFFLSLLRRAR
ncbi:MAG: cobalamin transport system permease protein [Acidobacteriota bacterium]|jgi:iron complex transport system permease protein|nr:cobalamin transport system permease protein [Acidobacteriota bacterium]